MRLSIVIALLLALASGAHATDKVKARALFKEGAQHFRLAEYQEALVAFKEAYRNFEDPTILFNIGQCERQLDHKEDAVRIYRNYLAEVPNAANRAEVEAHITKLETAIADEKAAQEEKAQKAAAAATPALAPTVVATPAPPPPAKQPVYKKWWLWTIVGVAVVGIGVGVGLGVGLHNEANGLTGTTFGVAQPFK